MNSLQAMIAERPMKDYKQNMIDLQLMARGITNSAIIEAFSEIDKEDFVPHKYRRQAYCDIDLIAFSSKHRSILRCFVLARVLDYAIKFQMKNVLIVGDFLGYTSTIFARFCENCVVGATCKQDVTWLRKAVQEDIKVDSFENIHSKRQSKFDFVFFDSGFYGNAAIKKASELLVDDGLMIYFSREASFDLSSNDFEFTKTIARKLTKNGSEDLFAMDLFFPSAIIA